MSLRKLSIYFLLISLSGSAFAQGTLLVANKNEATVSFLSVAGGNEILKVGVGVGPHEIAVSPSGKIAAVANYGNKESLGNSISILDVETKKKIKDIDLRVYKRPHGIEFINESEFLVTSEANQVLLKVHTESGVVTEVAKTNQLVSHMVAYSSTDKKAYVANIGSGTVSMIDVATSNLLKQIEFKKNIEGLAISPDGKELWVANREDSTVTAVNTSTFEKLAVMPAHLIAYRVKFLPNGKYVFVSNGQSGTLGVYDVQKKKMIQDIDLYDSSIPGENGERSVPVPVGITVSNDSKYVFVSTAGYDQVAVIRTKDWKIEKVIKTGSGPDGIYYSPLEIK